MTSIRSNLLRFSGPRLATLLLLCSLSLLLALPALAQQAGGTTASNSPTRPDPTQPADDSADPDSEEEAAPLPQDSVFDSAAIEKMREERRVMIQEERAEVERRREMIRNNSDHPAIQAGIAERSKHLDRLAKLDRIKQIGEQNSDQALIDRALAARDLELRRYFMWRHHHRHTVDEIGATIPQSDNPGE